MSSIAGYLKTEVLLPRLRQRGCLVVYDREGIYREICASFASSKVEVLFAGTSGIECRESAIRNLGRLGSTPPELDGFLVYVPSPAPTTEQDRQTDPYTLYAECGAVFPDGPADDFEQLCLRAKPDHATEIRRLFSSGSIPSFAVIDAVGMGQDWPRLRSMLNGTSPADICIALMCPSSANLSSLASDSGWVDEAKAFLAATLGLSIKLANPSIELVGSELWRFILFSEFIFNLPCDVPPSLGSISVAPPEARSFIEGVCDRLRNDQRYRTLYVEKAQGVEKEFDLAATCEGILSFGDKDTFPFEERASLKMASSLMTSSSDLTAVRPIVQKHASTVWMDLGENRSQWNILEAAWRLLESCADLERELSGKAGSLESLARFYADHFRLADQLNRELEQSLTDPTDIPEVLASSIGTARRSYRRLATKLQATFTKLVEASGWPLSGWMSNTEVFDKLVAPYLKERGRKVAFFMVDALRYELGLDLSKRLTQDLPVEIAAACAPLPTVTPIGMAALLPGARDRLIVEAEGSEFRPLMDGSPATSVTERMSFFAAYGDRFAHRSLAEFLTDSAPLPDGIELLVLRSKDIDSTLESATELNLGQLPRTLKQIRQAITKLKTLGFSAAIIAADHGFQLNFGADAGDVCAKPKGSWPISAHDRMLLGNGSSDSANLVMPAASVGIKSSSIGMIATPKSLSPYSAGRLYYHGGLSFQEAIVPVLSVNLLGGSAVDARRFAVKISYKNGAKLLSSRMPVVDIELRSDDLFTAQGDPIEILIEAQTKSGKVVGEAKPGGEVDPATRTIRLEPGTKKQLVLLMEVEFEGKFKLKALNPTTMATYDAIDLETDYVV